MRKKTLVLTGGGTAGHVLPCLALLPFLKGEFGEIHFIGSNSGYEEKLVKDSGVIYHGIDAVKLDRNNLLKAAAIPYKLHRAKKQAKKLLTQIAPDAIFSKGGYVALPTVLAAKKIPVYLHESDMTMGLANRLSLKKCRFLFSSFENIARQYENAIVTGAPLRQSVYYGNGATAIRECNLTQNLPYLLIMGGSSGARAINECVYSCLDQLCACYNVVHITGNSQTCAVKHKGYFALNYTDSIEDYYALADLVVSRGGAGALFELMALKKPTLIIPLPKGASRGDQVDNAKYFTEKGAAMTLFQQQLTAGNLIAALDKLNANKRALVAGMTALNNLDGTRRIAKLIIQDISAQNTKNNYGDGL